jgi:hypothetical protein
MLFTNSATSGRGVAGDDSEVVLVVEMLMYIVLLLLPVDHALAASRCSKAKPWVAERS